MSHIEDYSYSLDKDYDCYQLVEEISRDLDFSPDLTREFTRPTHVIVHVLADYISMRTGLNYRISRSNNNPYIGFGYYNAVFFLPNDTQVMYLTVHDGIYNVNSGLDFMLSLGDSYTVNIPYHSLADSFRNFSWKQAVEIIETGKESLRQELARGIDRLFSELGPELTCQDTGRLAAHIHTLAEKNGPAVNTYLGWAKKLPVAIGREATGEENLLLRLGEIYFAEKNVGFFWFVPDPYGNMSRITDEYFRRRYGTGQKPARTSPGFSIYIEDRSRLRSPLADSVITSPMNFYLSEGGLHVSISDGKGIDLEFVPGLELFSRASLDQLSGLVSDYGQKKKLANNNLKNFLELELGLNCPDLTFGLYWK